MGHVFADTAVNYTAVSPGLHSHDESHRGIALSIVVKRHFTLMPTILDTGK